MIFSAFIAKKIYETIKDSYERGIESSPDLTLSRFVQQAIGLNQSVASRILNESYAISSERNKAFQAIASYVEKDPLAYWGELVMGYRDFFAGKGDHLAIGIPTSATFTAPLLNALDGDFPEWLRLIHSKSLDKNEPIVCHKSDYQEKLFKTEMELKATAQKPFSDFYLSNDLLNLLIHSGNQHPDDKEGRFLDAAFCTDKYVTEIANKVDDMYILPDKNELLKVATITNGYSGLVCVFDIRKKTEEIELDRDLNAKNYHIKYCPEAFDGYQGTEKGFGEFLKLINGKEGSANFLLYGLEKSASFETFIDFVEQQIKNAENSRNRLSLLKILKARKEKIAFNEDNIHVFGRIANEMRPGNGFEDQKLVLVGVSPYMHNTWQMIFQYLAEKLEKDEFVHLTRFNFSQWAGKDSYSLYINKKSFSVANLKRCNQLISLINSKWPTIKKNENLPKFYFYSKTGRLGEFDNRLEASDLFARACQEMGFDSDQRASMNGELVNTILTEWHLGT